ncbi:MULTISPECIES: trypsin-like peptidase domain-containing protein [Cupriavidus]|uniref:Trypsin-like serine protease n=1 Tax=Cupriavidus pauculus TaxID=82633 RepID=A0A5P2HE81_9BURK|nr:trypsin-like peptidase domain-containing protein [Cupriavidus pauculus]QET05330.1 trypsin-like serine protease [Cupriavidus pauculus]
MKRVTIYGWISVAIALVFAAGVGTVWLVQPKPRVLTQADIDAAVLHTLTTKSLPSRTARAAEAVRESVVEIRGYSPSEKTLAAASAPNAPNGSPKNAPKDDPKKRKAEKKDPAQDRAGKSAKPPPAGLSRPDELAKDPARDATKDPTGGKDKSTDRRKDATGPKGAPAGDDEPSHIGSGVVVTESGTVITNYHVVAGARRLEVRFHDGYVAEATVVQAIPEKDLAIVKPMSIPDDLPAATLGSSRDLAPGSEVVAVGFPFGIGPSVSAGVVSGLDREFISPDSKVKLDKLIQFDAAANPGNSGGPLVNMNGEVVGIVTAILNPSQSGTFIGIGFAITIESAGGSLGSSPF